ncbi:BIFUNCTIONAL INHIBITOR/LIPID-TRANSFER PROTEIN/SEED STORAGE 2S ALBUMIN SUPERFAMILY PROTEIN [Salix koriyanagi]|uniref:BIFUNCTIONAL INHIBITOR/LIPID-TRANSFER PROTEIN/SEED STORAGE 2S ALBUMIN SUPERFAMILY PROTEIN n=1 Tax=Salix koriyanagi TaxID=2511006 RepID=A0A9Q0PG95_9ROSI|nr:BIFUNCTIONAL INHIBITOR/LIPID-TRANSFER PROTEIN/SEED STORAGE 2S ALBUMIN SUPERFAMILY PROTEIN [Salix koriyanagi]
MDPKTTALSFFLILSSCVFLGFSGVEAIEMACMQNLLPCKPYLQGTEHPPPVCCLPLKNMVAQQTQCLCSVLTNPDLLKDFNVTVDGALKLAKTCGASVDMSVCKNATSPSGSPATSSTPTTPNVTTPSGSNTAPKECSK